ncbi:MAG: hypothetical protein KDJ55_01010 [Rhodobiaceae bacterium]|nr:hypothetical protein [Rhodobiaceae bacterium]
MRVVEAMLSEFGSYFDFALRPDDDLICSPILEGQFQKSGLYIQQLIKLQAARLVNTPHYMTLDADILLRANFAAFLERHEDAIPYHQEPATLHRNWWRASARVLRHFRAMKGDVMGVTPEFLITDVVRDLIDRLQNLAGRRGNDNWQIHLMIAACRSSLTWSEYSLYWTYFSKSYRGPHKHEASRIYDYCGTKERALQAIRSANPAPVMIAQSSSIGLDAFDDVVHALGITHN